MTRILAFRQKSTNNMTVEIDASRLEEVKKSDKSYDSLVLADDSKKMIQAVVRRLEKQETEKTWAADFVAGKGSGGIILLHGTYSEVDVEC